MHIITYWSLPSRVKLAPVCGQQSSNYAVVRPVLKICFDPVGVLNISDKPIDMSENLNDEWPLVHVMNQSAIRGLSQVASAERY